MSGDDQEAGQALETETDATPSYATAIHFSVQGEPSAPADMKKPPLPRGVLLAILGIVAAAGLYLFISARARSAATPPSFQDLGAGISNPTGLKGNLKARWQGKAQYELKIEPIDPLQSAGFSYVAANPPAPLYLHMKLLDGTGFEVCGKNVLFPFDAASPGEQDRERGQDILQTAVGDDGKVMALSAQGTLPCTAEQYKQIVYWDFSTNFPALAEQDELMKQSAQLKARQEAQKRAALQRQKAPRSAFYLEGDDRVTGYDAQRKMLQTGLGRNFLVTGSAAQSTASVWAANSALFHYKCDQRSRCLLTHAGGTDSLSVFALQ